MPSRYTQAPRVTSVSFLAAAFGCLLSSVDVLALPCPVIHSDAAFLNITGCSMEALPVLQAAVRVADGQQQYHYNHHAPHAAPAVLSHLRFPSPSSLRPVFSAAHDLHSRSDTPPPNDLHNPVIAAALVAFLVLTAIILACYHFGPSLQRRFIRKLEKERSLVPAFGFGFDGLTKEEMIAVTEKEMASAAWFVKLPAKPPAVALAHNVPSTPLEVSVGLQAGAKTK